MRYNRVDDEGYYSSYCSTERRYTEHESGECLSCWNKEAAKRAKRAFYNAFGPEEYLSLDELNENS